jgi:hypothetical protein
LHEPRTSVWRADGKRADLRAVRPEEPFMADLAFIALAFLSFALAALLVRACERL